MVGKVIRLPFLQIDKKGVHIKLIAVMSQIMANLMTKKLPFLLFG
jgi:hypothetical protein